MKLWQGAAGQVIASIEGAPKIEFATLLKIPSDRSYW